MQELSTMPSAAGALADPLQGLVSALTGEAHLLESLTGVLRSQRAGVAAQDVPAVDASVEEAHRLLLSLEGARRRRRELLTLLAGREAVRLDEIEATLGGAATSDVREAAATLRRCAAELSHETVVNREVLRGALRSGEDHLRALIGGGKTAAAYSAAPATQPVGMAGGAVLNRRV